jgi:cytochrome P450
MIAAENLPTPPNSWPMLGHLVPLLRDAPGFLQAQRTLGDLVKIRLGFSDLYMVNSPDLIVVMNTTDAAHYDRGLFFDRVRKAYGPILSTTHGIEHRTRRRQLQPAFRHHHVADYASTMIQLAEQRINSWRAGQTLDAKTEMLELALDVSTQTLVRSPAGKPLTIEFRQSMTPMLRGLLRQTLLPQSLLRLPTPANRRTRESTKRMTDAFDALIADYHTSKTHYDDILSVMLATRTSEKPMTDREIRNEALTLVMAGYQGAGSILCWAVHELARNPDIERLIQLEVDRHPASEGWAVLDYTGRFVKEVIRLYCPLLLTRSTLTETSLGPATFPPRSHLAYSPFAMHRDPKAYPDPLQLSPDRWLPENDRALPRTSSYMPFGTGPYQCLGDHYSVMMITIALATITRKWILRPVAGTTVRMSLAGPAVIPNQLPMSLTARQPASA